jgi:cyanophycinase-like exopeptidase
VTDPLPRLLTIMGSGETAPTMIKVHRSVVERLGPPPVHGVLLDTPFGFQTNAPDIAARAVDYFRDSVGASLEVAGLRSAADLEPPHGDAVIARIAAAPFLFSGPGSPSYALRQWRGTLVPAVLAEKLALGGAVTFASAAALVLGVVSIPVYEVYKVGEDARWLEGLDLLGALGLHVALIPHYDNAEGGTHDTRFSYLGEQRLAALEHELPDDVFVLGVDEHTALCLDLDAGSATVAGNGGVTVRARGHSTHLPSGETFPIDRLAEMADDLAHSTGGSAASGSGGDRVRGNGAGAAGGAGSPVGADGGSNFASAAGVVGHGPPLLEAIRAHEAAFRVARGASDAPGMVISILALEEEMWSWRADTQQSDEMDRGRAALRTMVSELGQVAEVGTRDPASIVGPFVDLALALRAEARTDGRYADADAVRDRLVALGVEVHDRPDGVTWDLSGP